MDYLKLGIAFIFSFAISFLATPLVIKIYRRFGWLDNPKGKKHPKIVHKYPVPRGGGLPIFFAITLTAGFFLGLDKHLIAIIAGLFILAVTGFLDDIFNLNPYLRLFLGFLACCCVVGGGIGIPFITNPFGGGVIPLNSPQIPIFILGKTRHIWLLADIFAVFWILACMNFINWSKGVDGQLPGIAAIAAIVIGLASLKFSADITQWPVIVLAFITAGAYLGFLPFNLYPQKIMPGYGGGSIAGFMLAVLSILATTKVGIVIMVLGIPFADALFVITRRIISGRSPVWGDAGHLHHRLLRLGWSKKKIAIFYWITTLFLGLLALSLSSRFKLYTIIIILFLLGGFFLWTRFIKVSLSQPGQNSGSKI